MAFQEACRITNADQRGRLDVCSKHFAPEDLTENPRRRTVVRGAVPSRNLPMGDEDEDRMEEDEVRMEEDVVYSDAEDEDAEWVSVCNAGPSVAVVTGS